MTYRDKLTTFTADAMPMLDEVVMGALELLQQQPPQRFVTERFTYPLVVGSGNAAATGKLLFSQQSARFASESTVDAALKDSAIDEVVIVSASGGKHAPIIAQKAVDAGKHISLVTNTRNSLTEQAVAGDSLDVYAYPKNREPYTYNTSTYLSMLAGATGESAAAITSFIEDILDTNYIREKVQNYNAFYLIIPPKFEAVARMLNVKFIELFGRHIARDVETSEYVQHATTISPADELFISFGSDNTRWGAADQRLTVSLPEDAGIVAMVAIGYYVIGQIQRTHPPYFQDNIVDYCNYISAVFGERISPIVDAS